MGRNCVTQMRYVPGESDAPAAERIPRIVSTMRTFENYEEQFQQIVVCQHVRDLVFRSQNITVALWIVGQSRLLFHHSTIEL